MLRLGVLSRIGGAGIILLCAASAASAVARDNFEIELTVESQTGRRGFRTLERAVDVLGSDQGLRGIVSSYTPVSPATAVLNLRGVRALASFPANSPVLRLQVPGAGIDRTFNGATREESSELLLRWLQGRENSAEVTRLLRESVRSSPVDPVVGNPNAAMNQFVASDFSRALEASVGAAPPGVGLGARFGSFSSAGYSTQSVSLPLDYTWSITPRDTLQIDVPLSWTDAGGASSYAANVGVLYRRQILDNWTLQPSFRIGAAGSVDLGGGAAIWSVALNSTFRIDLPEQLRLTIANAVTYISTIPASIGDYRIDYDVKNTVFRNGLVLSRDLGFQVLDLPVDGSVFFVDTRFTGDAVYMRSYQEMGFFLTARGWNPIRFGFTYLIGDRGTQGFSVNTGITF